MARLGWDQAGVKRNHSPSSGYPLRDVLADQQRQERGGLFGIILLSALCDAAADYTASCETMIAGSVSDSATRLAGSNIGSP